jgi:Ca2+-binding RTX toxin-like protein
MPYYSGTAGNDIISGSSNDDDILGRDGSDTLYGNSGDDNVIDNDGQNPDMSTDSLYGGGGDDFIYAGYLDNADGGSGFDALILRLDYAPGGISVDFSGLWSGGTYVIDGKTITNFEQLWWATGTQYDDLMITGSVAGYNSELTGLGGNDLLGGGAGNDILQGDRYYLTIITNDIYYDEMVGGSGNDALGGGIGDYFDGGSGTDKLGFDAGLSGSGVTLDFVTLLSTGSDVILGSSMTGIEDIWWVYGSNYDDVIDTSYDSSGTTLGGRDGDDILVTGSGSNQLYGGAGSDTLFAGSGNDDLYGEDGDDVLHGELSNDSIYGGAGNDAIYGGSGLDNMRGEDGADIFYFAPGDIPSAISSNSDRIFDFSSVQGDKIDLAAIDAIVGGSDNAFAFIGNAAFTNVAGQLRYASSGGSTAIYGDTNGDGAADFAIRLDGTHTLAASDFIL